MSCRLKGEKGDPGFIGPKGVPGELNMIIILHIYY